MTKLYFKVNTVIQETGVSSVYKGTIVSDLGEGTGLKVNTRKHDFQEGSRYVLKIYGEKVRYDTEHAVFKLLASNPHPYIMTPVVSERSTRSAFFKAGDDDLFNYCERDGDLTIEQKGLICTRIIEAMKHLHSLGILHADLKLENVVYFGEPENLQVIDFTHSKIVNKINRRKNWKQMIGTKSLQPPEVQRGFDYDHALKIDSWLVALVIYELYTWTDPLRNGRGLSLKKHLVDNPGRYALLTALTHQDPEARMAIADIDTSVFN